MNVGNGNFLAGFAKEDITPDLGCALYGYPAPVRPAKRVLDRLEVGAAVFRQDGKTVIFISSELCAFDVDKVDAMRKDIAEEIGTKWEDVILSAIHTHSGPITRSSAGWGSADNTYLDGIFLPQAIKAAKRAAASLQPAVMGIGITESLTGVNRRIINAEGKVDFGQNPDGPYDPTMTVICFKSLGGENIGSMVHIAAHPTAAARNLSITRDWPGVMIDRMTEITKAPCLYFNGAEGDIGPRISTDDPHRGEEYIYEAGGRAAADAEKAYGSIEKYEVPKLNTAYGKILLPFVTPPSREYVETRIKEIEKEPEKIEGVRANQYAQLKKVKAVYDSGEEFPRGIEFMQTTVALGDLAIVPAPFEAFCNISLAIKERSPYKHTVFFGLSGGSRAYLPTEDQIPAGGYEVDIFRSAGVVSLMDDTDKRFIAQNLDIVEKMYRN